MVTIYGVPADALVEEAAGRLEDHIEQPDWMAFAKSGQTRELPPQQDDFWHARGASLLRRVTINDPVGIDRLSTEYGGLKRGSDRYSVSGVHSDAGSKNTIRTLLRQLEEEDLVETAKGEGRHITAEGTSFLNNAASDVLSDLDRPELERYTQSR